MWSRVDLPTPEAPTSATISPARTTREAPRSTRRTSGPERYSLSSSSPTRSGAPPSLVAEVPARNGAPSSLIAEDVHGGQRAGPPSGDDRGQQGQQERRPHHQGEVA